MSRDIADISVFHDFLYQVARRKLLQTIANHINGNFENYEEKNKTKHMIRPNFAYKLP